MHQPTIFATLGLVLLAGLPLRSFSIHPHTRLDVFDGLARLILNIGCNQDPPNPFKVPEGRVGVFAIEARTDTASKILDVEDRWVLTCAIAPYFGLASFNSFQDSSSLLEPRKDVPHWDLIKNKNPGKKLVVPTVPLHYILASLGRHKLWFMKTDTQGMDLSILRSAGELLKEVHYIQTEVWCNNYTSYIGTDNDFDKHWLPFMAHMGFEATNPKVCELRPEPHENNAIWRNTKTTMAAPTIEECPVCYN